LKATALYVDDLLTTSVYIDEVMISTDMFADFGQFDELVATTATVGALTADTLDVTTATAGALTADTLDAGTIDVTTGAIDSLTAQDITAQDITAQDITAQDITASTITADYGEIDFLSTPTAILGETNTLLEADGRWFNGTAGQEVGLLVYKSGASWTEADNTDEEMAAISLIVSEASIAQLANSGIHYVATDDAVVAGDVLYLGDDGKATISIGSDAVIKQKIGVAVAASAASLVRAWIDIDAEARIVCWETIRVSAMAMKDVATASPPTFANTYGNMYTWEFATGADDQLFFVVEIPHGYIEGTDIVAHCHWFPKTRYTGIPNPTYTVTWALEYEWENIDAYYGVATTVTAPWEYLTAEYKRHFDTEIGTLSGTGKTISSVLLCRLYRDVSADNYPSDACLLGVDFRFQTDGCGSVSETSK